MNICAEEKFIVLYGAGFVGQVALKEYGKDSVRFFCDGDPKKIGTVISGIEVISKEQLLKIKDEVEIVITTLKEKEVGKELLEIGITEYQVYEFAWVLRDSRKIDELRNSIRPVIMGGSEKKGLQERKLGSYKKDERNIAFALHTSKASEWIILESLYEAAKKECCCYFVINRWERKDEEELKAKGIDIYYADEYEIEKERPDVVIYANDYVEDFAIDPKKAKKYAKKVVLITYDMVIYPEGYSTLKNISKLSKLYLRQHADLCFVNPDYVQKFGAYQNNLVPEGNPKLDYVYKMITQDVFIPDKWNEKIKSRKIVMWATTHGLMQGITNPYYTFDIWAQDIIDYFKEHKEYALLFRPSSIIFDDLISSGICTYKECKYFEELFNSEENFILDDTSDYGMAYQISDALLCPPNGMLLSYLPTKKPIVFTATYRTNYSFTDKELIENYYIARDKAELIKSLDDIFYHNDPLYEKRMETLEKYIPRFDGKIGERIMKRILDELQ